ncbi:MAG: hypothetical protein ABIL09_26505 [Gemmatimonadota bacterium]
MIAQYLEDLERRIDGAVEEELMAQWTAFAEGRWSGDAIFSPRRPRPSPPGLEWPHVLVDDTLDSFELMALQQLEGCSHALEQASGALLAVRANYGTSILPSLFGARLFLMDRDTDTLPTSWPLEGGPEAIRRLLDRGVPDFAPHTLGGRALAMGRCFVELFAPYPRVRRHVHLYHPDLQGPMDLCELLWGSRLYLDIADEPALVHAFLALLTETYTRFLEAWQAITPPRPGCAVHWSLLHRGAIMLRDDSAMNFSPAMFEAFIEPYDQELLERFGGGAIHFCGRGEHYIHRLPEMYGVNAVNLSQPEYNDMETIFRHTVDRGLQIIGLQRQAAEAAVAEGRDLRGRVHCW